MSCKKKPKKTTYNWIVNINTILLVLAFLGFYVWRQSITISYSPFINIPYDYFHSLSTWVFDNLNTTEGISYFAGLDIICVILGTILLQVIFRAFYNSINDENNERKLEFNTNTLYPKNKSNLGLLFNSALLLFFTFSIINASILLLNEIGTLEKLSLDIHYLIKIKKIALCFTIGILLFQIFKILFEDFAGKEVSELNDLIPIIWNKYLVYNISGIVYLIILLKVFPSLEQTHSMILDLLSAPSHLILFFILFLFTVITVWYLPYYMQFTEAFYRKEREEFKHNVDYNKEELNALKCTWKNLCTAVNDLKTFKGQVSKQEEILKSIRIYFDDTNRAFHVIRIWFGVAFILFLLKLELQILETYSNNTFDGFSSMVLIMMVLLIVSYGYYFYTSHTKYEYQIKPSSLEKKLTYGIWTINTLSSITLLICIYFNDDNHQFWKLWLFIINTCLFCFSFLSIALYRRHPKFKIYTISLDKFVVWFNLNIYNRASFIAILILFLVSLIKIDALAFLSPINIFLIVVNGILVIFALVDRFFVILFSKNPQIKNTWMAFGMIIVLAFFATRGLENHFHDIKYHNYTAKEKPEKYTFENYTNNFYKRIKKKINPDTSFVKPEIVFIAADGGGLRAAYWNFLLMKEIFSKDEYKHVFLVTGCSGGGIGQSMYLYNNFLKADKIATQKFLSIDLLGVIGRSFLTALFPIKNYKNWDDRADIAAQHYFELAGTEKWKIFRTEPFNTLWQKNKDLPINIVNTARSENGGRGIVHPFADDENFKLNGFMDLSKIKEKEDYKYISYPDAVFLTNRFPGISPSARIEGKGHFNDGGAFDNTALSTVEMLLHQLQTLQSGRELLFNKDSFRIKVINISNSKSVYMKTLFKDEYATKVNRSNYKGEIGVVIDEAANVGTVGFPEYHVEKFENPVFQQQMGINTFKHYCLPYIIQPNDVHNVFNGQIADDSVENIVDYYNKAIKSKLSNIDSLLVMPPLGRLLNQSSIDYMKDMVKHPVIDINGTINNPYQWPSNPCPER